MYWAPELTGVAREDEHEFARLAGWPEALVDDFRARRYILKSLLAVRCRLEHLPFASAMSEYGEAAQPLDRDDRAITQQWVALGIQTLVTVPLHLPRAQVGLLGWGGILDLSRAQAYVSEASTELMGLGHIFASRMEQRWRVHPEPEDRPRLTAREQECLQLVASGFHVPEVADRTSISQATVRFHLDNAREKLGASSQAHAVALAVQLGLLGPIGR
ncbi:MAG: LuxR C-terminal-related transcriptional regulator [Myxococcota bacterium]|nr:LuxR C-terminal-related transcriptional regulator [Myxococcota bacterium]